MTKTYFTVLLSLVFSNFAFSENPKDALLLRSGILNPTPNISEFISEIISQTENVDGYYYRLIQFKDFPKLNELNEIKESGILLNYYIPYHAYVCAIPFSFDKNKLVGLKASSVIKWESNLKLDKDLTKAPYPAFAMKDGGMIDLIVLYQSNIDQNAARLKFELRGYKILSEFEIIHSFKIRIASSKIQELASLPFVFYVEPIAPPSTKDDVEGRSLHRSNVLNSSMISGRHYDGTGVTVAIGDDGAIGPHIDFQGRLTQHLTSLGGSHGDMTSGICVGAGNLIQRVPGMASGAHLHIFDFTNYPQVVDAVNNYNNYGIVIASTSYSQACNQYSADSRLGDQLIHDNPQLEFCFSAGNNGTGDCGYGAGNGWGNITGGYKQGKNVIACGNVDAEDILDGSSSRGPASDGRIKPDICANGVNQRSTDQDNLYQVGGGTSAASPGVAGVLAQLYQAYKEITGQSNPPSGLIKAAVLNGGEDLGNPGPDYQFGWGRINAYRAVTTIEDHRYLIDSIQQGVTNTHSITVPPGVQQLRVMLYWHDEGGTPAVAKALVNDLDLHVINPSSTSFDPWVLNPTPNIINLNAPAIRSTDTLNNVEQVTIDSAPAGTYDFTVRGTQIPTGIQKYFIVYEFRTDSIHVTFPIGGEGLAPFETELIRWDAYGNTGSFNVRFSTDAGSSWNTINPAVSGSLRYCTWNVPNVVSDSVLIEVSRNGVNDLSDSTFTIIRKPTNFHITFACPDSIGVAWNTVPGATAYNVYKLGNKYMDLTGTSNTTNFVIPNVNPMNENWFSVNAIGAGGGKGPRADAILKLGGLQNCALTTDGEISTLQSPEVNLFTDCINLSAIPVTILIHNAAVNSIGNFDVNFSIDGGTSVTENITGPIAGGTSISYDFSQNLSITGTGTHIFKVWLNLPGDENEYNDTMTLNLEVISGTSLPLPIFENFDSNTLCSTASDCELTICPLSGGWINLENGEADNIDWRVNHDTTPSANTGPPFDHTTGNATGNYIYLEASGTCNSQTALMYSPCFDLNGVQSAALTFWYHMFGSGMGELHIDAIVNGNLYYDIGAPIIGNHGNAWLKDSISLNQFSGEKVFIRFHGTTGTDYLSDMALDDIGIYNLSTGVSQLLKSESHLSVFPNPSQQIFNYRLFNLPGKIFTMTVADIVGRIVYDYSGSTNASGFNGTIDLSGQPKGVYTLTFRTEKSSEQIKLIKIN